MLTVLVSKSDTAGTGDRGLDEVRDKSLKTIQPEHKMTQVRQKKGRAPGSSKRATRRRLSPSERQQMILEGAITYYAEYGFDGRSRGLADYLGISQSLLYRYFPNMASLVDRIYETVYIGRWNSHWQTINADRSLPLEARLKIFYKDYYQSINKYETIRITMFSALRGENVASRYIERIKRRLIRPIVAEIRHTFGMPTVDDVPVLLYEEEVVFSLHSAIIYASIREHIFHLPTPNQNTLLIDIYVDSFVAGVEASFRRIHETESS